MKTSSSLFFKETLILIPWPTKQKNSPIFSIKQKEQGSSKKTISMKKYLLGLFPLLILLLACQEDPNSLNKQSVIDLSNKTPNEFSSTMNRIDQPEPDRQMNAIQAWYQQIEENLQYLNVKTIKSGANETITFYYKNDILVKAVVESTTNEGAKKDTYYWHKSKFFYCFEHAQKPVANGQKLIHQKRCYIFDNKVISYHQKEKIFDGEVDMRLAENTDLTKTSDLQVVLQEYLEKEKAVLTVFKENWFVKERNKFCYTPNNQQQDE